MNRASAEEFLRQRKQAVLATIGKDGRPHLSNVLVAHHDGILLLSTSESTVKYRNFVRDPRVVVHLSGDNFWEYLVVEGEVTVTRLPEALEPLHIYYRLAAGKDHPNWDEYDDAMRAEKRVLASISIRRMYPLSH